MGWAHFCHQTKLFSPVSVPAPQESTSEWGSAQGTMHPHFPGQATLHPAPLTDMVSLRQSLGHLQRAAQKPRAPFRTTEAPGKAPAPCLAPRCELPPHLGLWTRLRGGCCRQSTIETGRQTDRRQLARRGGTRTQVCLLRAHQPFGRAAGNAQTTSTPQLRALVVGTPAPSSGARHSSGSQGLGTGHTSHGGSCFRASSGEKHKAEPERGRVPGVLQGRGIASER